MAEVAKRRFGPPPMPPRDGDKLQARQRINVEVRTGRRPHPNQLPCVDCGHGSLDPSLRFEGREWRWPWTGNDNGGVVHVGTKIAGALLDGREHKEFPG